jgi:hypothetical protein
MTTKRHRDDLHDIIEHGLVRSSSRYCHDTNARNRSQFKGFPVCVSEAPIGDGRNTQLGRTCAAQGDTELKEEPCIEIYLWAASVREGEKPFAVYCLSGGFLLTDGANRSEIEKIVERSSGPQPDLPGAAGASAVES